MSQQPEPSETQILEKDEEQRKTLEVTIHNEDNGAVVKIDGHPNSSVHEVVSEMYSKFRLDRQTGDRLRCEGNGGDVFSHEAEDLNEYAKRFCSKLVWLFAGDQGGADGGVAGS